MSEAHASLSVRDGGLALPHVETDLLAMASTAVRKSAAGLNGTAPIVSDILLAARSGVGVYLIQHGWVRMRQAFESRTP